MKENILKIFNSIANKNHFTDCYIVLTLNFINVIPNFKPEKLSKKNIIDFHNILNNFKDEITSFNITFEIKRNCGNFDFPYGEKWKSISFIFYYKNEDEEIDTSKYGCFEIRSLGARGEFNLAKNLSDVDTESNERFARIEGNHFEYDKIDETIEHMIELDILLDETYDKELNIFNKMKLQFKNG